MGFTPVFRQDGGDVLAADWRSDCQGRVKDSVLKALIVALASEGRLHQVCHFNVILALLWYPHRA